jgi:AcrR family transcriptional regulator
MVRVASGLRELKKQRARAAMQRAALELVAQRGLSGVTVDDIAAKAGVAPRTFFNYFTSKEESLFAVDPALIEGTAERLETLLAVGTPFGALRVVLSELMSSIEDNPDDLRLRRAVVAREPALWTHLMASNTEFEASLAASIRQRISSAAVGDGYAELLVAACLAAARTAIQTWSTEPRGRSLREIYALHLDILERGLTCP